MAALGLAILLVAGAVTLDVILENTNNTDASVVGQTLSGVDLGGFFSAGVLVGIAGAVGLMLLLAGVARARRRRLERKELTRSYEGTAQHVDSLQEERDRLAAELDQERAARAVVERGGAGVGPAMASDQHGNESRSAGTHRAAGHDHQPPIYPELSGSSSSRDGEALDGAPDPQAPAGTTVHRAADTSTRPRLTDRLFGR